MSTEANPEALPHTAPTCYRHPDRETYIRCGRCERPICPDCMVSASVGFQCPECVREGNAAVRERRTPFGGRVGADPGYVSKVLIGVNVVLFLFQQLVPGFTSDFWLYGQRVALGEWYRLLTAVFLHGGILHLLFNGYALYLFGPPLEAALGRLRFVALYLLAGLGGSTASYAFNLPMQPSLGASGAIFGLLAAYLVVSRRLGRDASGLWVLLGLNLVLGFAIPNIDWRAHLGGFVVGGATAFVLAYAPSARRGLVQAAGLLVVLLAVLAAVTLRTADLNDVGVVAVLACAPGTAIDPQASLAACLSNGG